MKINETGIRGKALYIFTDGRALVYRKGNLYIYSVDYKIIDIIELCITPWKKLFGKLRLCERLLHIEPRFAVEIDKSQILLQLGQRMLLINIDTKEIIKESVRFRGRPLSYAKIVGVDGFEDSIVIGDYGANDKGEDVNIYQRNLHSGKWRTAFTYKAGTMWHIHGFVPNPERSCVYILAGDEDDQSGIWEAKNNFDLVTPIVNGSQQYRTCQMTYDRERIYYFTDAPSEPNYLYSYNILSKEANKITPIRGTCIYGCRVPGGIVASTTCEPDAHFKVFLYGMITTKPGKGVQGRVVDLLYYQNNKEVETLKTFQHDGMPLKLFQYGTVVFSNYNCGRVLCTPISVIKYDMRILEISFDE